MKIRLALLALIVASLPFIAAATEPPTPVVAEAPTFVDPSCQHGANHELPTVTGLDYRYEFDMEAPLDEPRFYVTVEPLEGYIISDYEGDFNPNFPHGFDPPISPGAWVHTYADPPRDCDPDRPEDAADLPSVGA